MQLELRHLRVICLIADAGSLSRAAAALGVPQASVSAQLKRIEGVLGGELFVRGRTGATPTEFGETTIARARAVVRGVEDILAEARARATGTGPLRVGGTPGMVFTSLVKTLKNIVDGRVVGRTELASPALVDLLAASDLDGATFLEFPGSPLRLPPGTRRAVIAAGPAFVILPAGHRLAGERQLHLSDLGGEEWVLPPAGGDGLRALLHAAFTAAGIGMRVSYEIADRASAMAVIGGGHALGLGQTTLPAHPGLVLKPLAGSPVRYSQVLVWSARGPLAPHVDALLKRVRADYRTTALAAPVFREWLVINGIPPERAIDPWGSAE